MELKDKLVSSFPAHEGGTDVRSPLHRIRTEAMKQFEHKGFPSKREEAWKYTSINTLLKPDYSLFPEGGKGLEFEEVKRYFIHDIDSYRIAFVDGRYDEGLSAMAHEGFDICLMSTALEKPGYREVVEKYFNSTVNTEDSLTSLNTAFLREGVFVHVPKGKVVDKPVQILHFSTGSEPALLLQPRNLIVAGENAQVQVIERHQSLSDHPVLTNSVTEIFAGKRAMVDYYKIQNDKLSASLIDNTYISQERESHVSVHTFSFGGKLTRNNLNFYHRGEYVESTLKGVTILEGQQHVDHHTLVNHARPDCESHQDYKGIYGDRSTGVFNGKVIVEKEAQKTNAFQQNNNILLDDKATVNTKPQLEIFADDVKCSHGCTIGQLDDDALFYLRSRGIPAREAKALMMYAFANNVLESVKIPEVQARINKLIARKLGVRMGFASEE
ncbi:Fe-S cluster assembly protein SufD [Sinomicrobium soli]|uniref:Fe-S cluster assembly protein SufD n=1 Tax=Sinomicrobium sp. N-1-3-6 TaxID=2219864 RepID=UPI000DCB6FBD|nr:Fe-S cluster assembly protein SufD [Sinomicrobium sp. N-1-3-6]RAV28355.1 Fe-S cluster assembly protein SufD [Sinomicrobium sp. N-1-3-6]